MDCEIILCYNNYIRQLKCMLTNNKWGRKGFDGDCKPR